MKRLTVLSFFVLFALVASTGCSVVKGSPETLKSTYQKLGGWQAIAKTKTAAPAYAKAQRNVNTWIEATAKEIEIQGNQLFGQVDVSVPKDVADAAKPIVGTQESAIDDILDWLLNKYKEGRAKEAANASAGLRDYKWPDPAK